MKVVVTGSSGFIGSAVVRALGDGGHRVVRLVRSRPPPGSGDAFWDLTAGVVEIGGLDGVDAVVHLAGESTAGGPWTAARKARMRESRVGGTRLMARTAASLEPRPSVMVCASAIGYYGDRGAETLTEESSPGAGFLPETGVAWEGAARPAADSGIRVANLRFGLVIGAGGGLLSPIVPLFRLGLGARLGDGSQYMSWVALADAVGAILHVLGNDALVGPVNVTSPNPVTNREFTEMLGRVLGRPTVLSMPRFLLQLAPGNMADEALLASARVLPTRLLATGYSFRLPELEPALRRALEDRALHAGSDMPERPGAAASARKDR